MAKFKFTTHTHFVNYLNKYADLSDFRKASNTDREEYNRRLERIFHEKKSEQFTWFLKTHRSFKLSIESFEIFKSKNYDAANKLNFQQHEFGIISNFDEVINSIINFEYSGVYIFSKSKTLSIDDKHCLYVGFSTLLCNRIASSLKQRSKNINESFYIHVLRVDNKTDAAMLEISLINSLCPTLNGSMSFSQRPEIFQVNDSLFEKIDVKTIKVLISEKTKYEYGVV